MEDIIRVRIERARVERELALAYSDRARVRHKARLYDLLVTERVLLMLMDD